MPMEGLVWTDVMHPDALPYYQHPEGRPHALMFPLIYLLQQLLMTDGTSEEVWRPQYRDGDGVLNDVKLSKYCQYVGVTSFRFLEFLEAFTSQMKKMLGVLKEDMFSRYGLVNTKDSSLKRFRAPNHPLWGTCLTVSLVRAGIQRIFVRLSMDNMYTNPVTGCRATLSDSSLVYAPGVLVAHAQTQNLIQEGTVEITSATAVPEELLQQQLLEHDWWVRNEWRIELARLMYEYLAQHTESVTFMRASSLVPTAKPEIINLRNAAIAVDYNRTQMKNVRNVQPGLLRGQSMWNFFIREEAVEKFRMYFRHEHILGVQTTQEEQEHYMIAAACFAVHEIATVTSATHSRANGCSHKVKPESPFEIGRIDPQLSRYPT
eukprot:2102047-Amphidinium_carterae.1